MNNLTQKKVSLYIELLHLSSGNMTLSEITVLCALSCDKDVILSAGDERGKLKEKDLSILARKIKVIDSSTELIKKC